MKTRLVLLFAAVAILFGTLINHVGAQSTAQVQGVTVSTVTNNSGGAYPTQVTVTWPVNFADDDVAVSCDVRDETAPFYAAYTTLRNIRTVSAAGLVALVNAGQSGAAANGKSFTLHCVGVHN